MIEVEKSLIDETTKRFLSQEKSALKVASESTVLA